jgi:hypothetical protein
MNATHLIETPRRTFIGVIAGSLTIPPSVLGRADQVIE